MSGSSDARGFLTESDREYLRGEADFAHASGERRKRQQIRNRTRRALEDFAFLHQYLDSRDRLQILDEFAARTDETFAELSGEERDKGPEEVAFDIISDPETVFYGISTGGLRSTQAFVALLFHDICEDLDLSETQFEDLLADLVASGIEDAYGRTETVVDAAVDIELETQEVDVDALRNQLEDDPTGLTDQEVEWLIQLRGISWNEYIEYLEETRY